MRLKGPAQLNDNCPQLGRPALEGFSVVMSGRAPGDPSQDRDRSVPSNRLLLLVGVVVV